MKQEPSFPIIPVAGSSVLPNVPFHNTYNVSIQYILDHAFHAETILKVFNPVVFLHHQMITCTLEGWLI